LLAELSRELLLYENIVSRYYFVTILFKSFVKQYTSNAGGVHFDTNIFTMVFNEMRQPNEPTARASTQMRFALLITCLREIEFIGANIKQFHANKVMALGHRKKPVKQVVSSGTP